MKRFFELTFRPFFVIAGLGTAAAGLFAFWPEWSVTHLVKLRFHPEYTIVVQHWGIMVGLMGVFMIVAAFRPALRNAILIYSAVEKSFMAYLVLAYASAPYASGFKPFAIVDASISLYTIAYFAVCGFKTPLLKEPATAVGEA